MLGRRYQEVARLQNERETMMVENFEEEIEQILHERPDLMRKDNLDVLVQMGSVHTTLRHKFTEKGMKSDRHFSTSPTYVYASGDELLRTYMYGRQPSDDQLMRAMSEKVLETGMPGNMTRSYDKYFAFIRAAVADLTPDEMELLYTYWNEGKLDKEIVDELFRNHGYDGLPNDEADIDVIIGKHEKPRHTLARAAIAKGE